MYEFVLYWDEVFVVIVEIVWMLWLCVGFCVCECVLGIVDEYVGEVVFF